MTATIPELLRDASRRHPDREAYVQGERRVTYAWLDGAADGFARTLLALGVTRGDVVTLLLPSSIEFAACYLGTLRAGAIASAINRRLGPVEQASILDRTKPRVTVVGEGAPPPDGADPGTLVFAHAGSDAFAAAAEPPDVSDFPEIVETDPTCIVWTSGTTGEPKGAVFDHATQRVISRNIGELTRPADRRLVVLPFAHVGYMTRMWDELANGTTLILGSEPWSPADHLRLVRDERVTMVTGVPTQWQRVLDHPCVAGSDFSGVRVAALGGAAIAPDLVRRMRRVLDCPVITRYTSTEAGVCTSTQVGDPAHVVAETVGKPAPDVELRLVDDRGHEVAAGDIGEVLCRSPAMMRGYWCDPVRTAEVIDDDGWLHTGDLGTVDADANLRIVGRVRDMYIRGGYNVYPAEVEAVLAAHPMVRRAAVVGAPHHDLGEVGVAFVVPAPGAVPAVAELREWCRARIADYKAPDRLVLVDDLPLTAMLKTDTRALAVRAREGP